jgi:phage shock protein C
MPDIKRSKRDRWILGVCGGVAQHYGWSSNVVRLVVALLAIFIPGVSVLPVIAVYILLGVLLPESEEF